MNTQIEEQAPEILDIDKLAALASQKRLINELRKGGMSGTQAKRTASSQARVVTKEMLEEAQFAVDAGLNSNQVIGFVGIVIEDGVGLSDKLRIFTEMYEIKQKVTLEREERQKFEEAERERKSHKIQIDGLKGTDKQVAWALQIREKVISKHGGGNDEFIKLAHKITSAKWWIDNRTLAWNFPFGFDDHSEFTVRGVIANKVYK